MVKVAFIRKNGRNKPRGVVADLPFGIDTPLPYKDPFIIVQVDETTIPQGVVGNPTVTLKLDKLQGEDREIKYTDEEGNEQVRIEYDYYSENGTSVDDCPTITMEDVTWQTT